MNTPRDALPTSTLPVDVQTLTVAERKALALQRLEASRTLLIQRLYPADDDHGATHATGGAADSVPRVLTALMSRVQRDGWMQGGWRALRAVSRRWWKRQPWHTSVDLVAGTLAREARPLVRRHPWACLAAAAALGAGLAWARPWVTHTVRQQTQGLHRHLGSLLWQQLAQAPVQLALAGALSTWLSSLVREAPARSDVRPAPDASPAPTQTVVTRPQARPGSGATPAG